MGNPTSRVRVVLAVLAAAALAAGGCSSSDDSNDRGGDDRVRSRSSADSRAREWMVYGHDFANSRFNPDERSITRDNVGRMGIAWSKEGLVGVTSTPTVAGGVAYFGDWQGKAWAVDATTGADVWTADVGSFVVGAPAIVEDAVYVSSGRTLVRLDRATGAVEWKAETNEHPLAQISASPVVVDGRVLQGVASAEVVMPRDEYTFRGSIGAYDTETGEERWRFYTTQNDDKGGAGVGIWSTPAIDRERGMLYVGTGNAYSEPTGPYADSILAIDYRSGELRWSAQFTNPDVWSAKNPTGKDADVGASPNLWTSGDRDLVGAGDKAGVYHAVDRDTGEVVWQRQLTPGSTFGGEIGSAAFVDGKLIAVSNVGDPATNAPTNVSKVLALDPATGKVIWESEEFPGLAFGPVGAVRGVAFVGTQSGVLAALDTRTGERLWEHEAPEKVGGGPSIVDGRVLWGYGFFLFGGPSEGGLLSFEVGAGR